MSNAIFFPFEGESFSDDLYLSCRVAGVLDIMVSLFGSHNFMYSFLFPCQRILGHFFFFYLYACTDPQKQAGGPAILEEPAQHQPIGLHIAITAATVMAGTLGGAQTVMQSNQNGLQSQPALASDPLTLHLAKMSRNQLNEIMSELKVRS